MTRELLNLCVKYYSGKKLKHSIRVADNAFELSIKYNYTNNDYIYELGLVHDLLEDTDCLISEISEELQADVLILTKHKNENYYDFITRIEQSPAAMIVKIADIQDHLAIINKKEIDKKVDKYNSALKRLKNNLTF